MLNRFIEVAVSFTVVAAACVGTLPAAHAAHEGRRESARALSNAAVTARVVDLRTEAQRRPLGIDVRRPRFTWRMEAQRRGVEQRSYSVVVARTVAAARTGRGRSVVWRSGTIRTARPWVDYRGPRLAPRTRYWWTVRLVDDRGAPVAPAPPAWFETAFTAPSQWRASWIRGLAAPKNCADLRTCSPAPLLRREFDVDSRVASARLYAAGLGYGTYHLNGRRVGDAVLSPGFTEYTERVLYTTSDVTRLLRRGRNALGVELGRGPFGSQGDNYAGYSTAPWVGDPRVRLELHVRYADGRRQVVRTGPGWRTARGPRLFDDYMLGETFDARRAKDLTGWTKASYDDRRWSRATAAAAPRGRLEAQVEDPVRPQRRIAFQRVLPTDNGTWVLDLGEDITGNAILRTDLPAGTRLTLHYGERLDDAGSVTTAGFPYDSESEAGGGPMQIDTYVAGPGPDVWRPEFTFKGFRYVEVSGLPARPEPSLLTAEVWRTDVERTGHFHSSDSLLNRIHAASVRSIEGNTVSIPMDTPIYEKTGYTADGQLVAEAASYMFDMRRFYAKWLTDIRQSVGPNGDMGISAPLPVDPPEQQPAFGFTHTSPGWDAALFVVPDVLERFGGDRRPGAAALPEMQRVREYYDTRTRGDIIPGRCTVAVVQFCDDGLGDWVAPSGSSSGAAVDSTAWYAWMLRRLEATARAAGKPELARSAGARAEAVESAFHRTFFDPLVGAYRDPFNPAPNDITRPGATTPYSQHQNALPLGLGVVPSTERQRVGDALAADVRLRDNHLSTGIMGTRFLFEALSSTGHVDEALAILQQRTYPSYGYWLDVLGYTGLGEYWEADTRSRNHQMYGSVVTWLHATLAGYRPASPGFADVEVRPALPSDGLDAVSASTRTVRGRVATSWRRTAEGLVLDVEIPANSRATVHVPAATAAAVRENGTGRSLRADSAPGVQLLRDTADTVVYRVGSGTYRFTVQS